MASQGLSRGGVFRRGKRRFVARGQVGNLVCTSNTTIGDSALRTIVVAVVIALIAGGSAPWWWGKLFPPPVQQENPPPPVQQENPPPQVQQENSTPKGIGACAAGGSPSNEFRDAPAPNGSLDWNCNG